MFFPYTEASYGQVVLVWFYTHVNIWADPSDAVGETYN